MATKEKELADLEGAIEHKQNTLNKFEARISELQNQLVHTEKLKDTVHSEN